MPGKKRKLCEFKDDDEFQEGCQKIPSFGNPGQKARFCAGHKEADMVNVNSQTCHVVGCGKQPNFGNPGGLPQFCSNHKEFDMVNVVTKTCDVNGCGKQPSYGIPGNKPTHCAQHRLSGMIKNPTARCISCKKKTLAIWGVNRVPRHCEAHRQSDDENLVERECVNCNLIGVLDANDKCETCNPDVIKRARLQKQNALMAYLDQRGLPGVSTDIIVDKGVCGLERPDRIYDFGDKIVILECDEHQHRHINPECERTRMYNIGQSFGGMPVYFLRWNPDNYASANGDVDIKKRYKVVGDLIRDIQGGKTKVPVKAMVAVRYLYYDGWSGLSNAAWQTLTEYAVNP